MKKLALMALAMTTVGSALADFSKAHVQGTWLLNGKDRNTKWVFNKDGSFNFVATMASSKGKWSVDGSKVKLVWTEIDKQKVKPGTVKGAYPLNSDGTFQVNKFIYRKVS